MAELKKLDPYAEEYKKATLQDLINDSLARKDEKALNWLDAESAKKDERTRNGVTVKVARNIAKIRADYARKYLGYKPKSAKSAEEARKRKQQKAEENRQRMFAEAREQMGK